MTDAPSPRALPRRRWLPVRRLAAILLVSVLLVVALLHLPALQRAITIRALHAAGAALGSELSVGEVAVNFFTGAVRARSLTLATPAGAPPVTTIAIAELEGRVALPALLAGRVVVRSLRLAGVDAHLGRDAAGAVVLPQPSSTAEPEAAEEPPGEPFELSFRAVELVDARLSVAPDARGRRLEVAGLGATGSFDLATLRTDGRLAADVQAAGPRGRLDERVSGRWQLAGSAGSLALELAGPLNAAADLAFSDLAELATYHGDATIAAPLDRVGEAFAPELGLAGALSARVVARQAEPATIELRVEQLAAAGLESRLATAAATWADGRLELSQLALDLAGGRVEARGAARLSPRPGDFALAATVTELELGTLLARLAPAAGVSGELSGTVELTAATAELAAVVAAVDLTVAATAPTPGTFGLDGQVAARLRDGVVELDRVDLHHGLSHLAAGGRVDLVERTWQGGLTAELHDVAPYLALAGLSGSGGVTAELSGSASPTAVALEGEIAVTALTVAGVAVDRGAATLWLADRHLDLAARDLATAGVTASAAVAGLELGARGSRFTLAVDGLSYRGVAWPRLNADGELGAALRVAAASDDGQLRVELRRAQAGDDLLVDATLAELELARLTPFLPDAARELGGRASATVLLRLDPAGAPIAGEITLSALAATAHEHRLSLAAPAAVRFTRPWLEVDGLALRLDDASRLDLAGRLDVEGGGLDLAIEAHDLDLAAWSELAGVALGGSCTATLRLAGTLTSPGAAGELAIAGLAVDALSVASVRAHFADAGEGVHTAVIDLGSVAWQGEALGSGRLEARADASAVAVTGTFLDGQADLTASVGLAAPQPVRAELRVDRLVLAAVAGAAGLPDGVTGIVSGIVRADGPLADLASGTLELDGVAAELTVAKLPVAVSLDAVVAAGRLRLARAELSGDSLRARASGALPLAADLAGGDDQLTVDIDGDLGVLLALVPHLDRAEGALTGTMVVTGSLAVPRFAGSLALADGSLDGPAFPAPVERLSGRLEATPGEIRLETLTARFAGGTVDATAVATLADDGPGTLAGTLRLRDVDAAVSPTLELEGDADLSLGGSLTTPKLGGELRFERVTVVPKVDVLALLGSVASKAIAVKAEPAGVAAAASGPAVDLDLLLLVPGTCEVVGTMVDTDLSARLQVGGSTAAPVVTGSITVDRGSLVLLGSDFDLNRGSLDFLDPEKIDPELEISGTTDKGGDRITVTISGHASQPYLQFSSDSGASQEEILRQLMGGGAGGTGAGTAEVLLSGSAISAATALAAQLGLSSGLEIVPFPVTPEGDSLLFMVSKEVGSGVVLRYGMARESGDSDVVEVVAELGEQASATVRQNTDGTVSGGLRWRGKIR